MKENAMYGADWTCPNCGSNNSLTNPFVCKWCEYVKFLNTNKNWIRKMLITHLKNNPNIKNFVGICTNCTWYTICNIRPESKHKCNGFSCQPCKCCEKNPCECKK